MGLGAVGSGGGLDSLAPTEGRAVSCVQRWAVLTPSAHMASIYKPCSTPTSNVRNRNA